MAPCIDSVQALVPLMLGAEALRRRFRPYAETSSMRPASEYARDIRPKITSVE
ncbi:MAG: hypothetical protein GY854_02340 [Deltaproteobacteria bacterium]|nr:hypothetical protein [Deltaproteobacteria bacterium]